MKEHFGGEDKEAPLSDNPDWQLGVHSEEKT